MRARRGYWLAGAAGLFALSALVMSWAGDPKPPPPRTKMPLAMDDAGEERLHRRRTLPPLVAPNDAPGRTDERPPLSDPLMRAMPHRVKQSAIVLEASALRNSPVGQLLIDCLNGSGAIPFDTLKGHLGIDPLVDLDRVSEIDDTTILTGQFADAKWPQVFDHATPIALNDHTTLWQPPVGKLAAVWRDQMVVMAPTRGAIDDVVARLEGTAPVESPVLDEGDSYGEMYGVVTPSALAALLDHDQPALAERLRQVLTGVSLHVDASHDVGIVVDAKGADHETGDLGRAVGSAMAVGRLAALAQDNKDLGQILDSARVVPQRDDSRFRAELALPLTFFEDKLRDCGRNGRGGTAGAPAGEAR